MLIKLSWRNIGRNKRRTLITITAIAFATLISIAMRGLQIGTYKENIDNAVSLFTGYIQIQRPEFLKNPSLQKSFLLTDGLRSTILTTPYIKGMAPRIYSDALIALQDKSFGVAIFGISPEQEATVTKILEKTNNGRFFSSDTTLEIVVGYKLLKNLEARIGDTVVVLSQGFDGTMGNMLFKIVGTIKTGSIELDRSSVFMGLKTAQELLSMYGRVNAVAISVTNAKKTQHIKRALNKKLLKENELVCRTWEEILPELKNSIDFDNVSGALMLAVLVIVVAFGILNTLLMSVTERFREFGILLAIGMPNKDLARMVLLEGIIIMIIGLAIGNSLAVFVNHYFSENPITISGNTASIYEEYGFLPVLKSSLDPLIFIRTNAVIMTIALLSILYPVLKVKNLEPLKGIRYT